MTNRADLEADFDQTAAGRRTADLVDDYVAEAEEDRPMLRVLIQYWHAALRRRWVAPPGRWRRSAEPFLRRLGNSTARILRGRIACGRRVLTGVGRLRRGGHGLLMNHSQKPQPYRVSVGAALRRGTRGGHGG